MNNGCSTWSGSNFMELLATTRRRARIEYMLKNGKPLRN